MACSVLKAYCYCAHRMTVKIIYCRSMVTGDVSTAAKVNVDQVPSISVSDIDGGGDNSGASIGHQSPLVVRESDLPG